MNPGAANAGTRDRGARAALALGLTCVALLSPSCGGSGKHTSSAGSAPTAPVRAPFLWKVERNGAVNHVLGTVHLGVSLSELPDVVTRRLDDSRTLIVEANTDDVSSVTTMASMVLPPDKSLRTMLGDEHWAILLQYLEKRFPAPMLDRLPPWMVQSMLSLEESTSARDQGSLDSDLVARAKKQRKPLVYLETPEEQLQLLATVISVEDLRMTLDDVPGARRNLQVLLRAYRSGNLAALMGIVLDPEDVAQDPEEFELLLFARNRAWMRVLEPALARGGVFLGVGAAHYLGENGLLELFRAAGFQVTRVLAEPLERRPVRPPERRRNPRRVAGPPMSPPMSPLAGS